MMYPRGIHKPHSCKNCGGTGRINDRYEFDEYACEYCNGTGIEGSPRLAVIIGLLMGALAWSGFIVWLLRK